MTKNAVAESVVQFTVRGDPVTQGSMTAFATRRGRAVVHHASGAKLTDWRRDVGMAALVARGRRHVMTGPVAIQVLVLLRRPKRPQNVGFPCAKGRADVDKFLRGIFDALSGILVEDDAQFVDVVVSKRWAAPGEEGVCVRVAPIGAGGA